MSSVSRILKYDSMSLEEKLLMIQFPKVSITCMFCNISRETVYSLWERMEWIFDYKKNEFEIGLKMILARLSYCGSLDNLKQDSIIGWYYYKFSSMGVEFKINEINNNTIDIIIH